MIYGDCGPSHVLFPSVTSRFSTTSSMLFTSKCSSNLRSWCWYVNIYYTTIRSFRSNPLKKLCKKIYIYNLIAQMIYLIILTRSWMKKTFHVFFRTRIFEFNNSISIKTEKEQEGAYTYVYIMEIFIHITVYGSIYRL